MKAFLLVIILASSVAGQVSSGGKVAMSNAIFDMRTGKFIYPERTVAGLGAASSCPGCTFYVTNGTNESDCSVGGGTTRVNACYSDGSTWTFIGGFSCSLCTTAASTLADLSIVSGAGSRTQKTTNLTTDSGLNNLGIPGILQTNTADSTHAGFIAWPAGTNNWPGNASTVGIGAPASITGGGTYELLLPITLPIGGTAVFPTVTANTSQSTWAPSQRVVLTSPYTNATTGLTNVTGFAFPVLGSATYSGGYIIRCNLIFQGSAGTAGMQLAWTGPSSPTTVTYFLNETTTSGAASVTHSSATTGSTFGTVLGPTTLTSTATDMPAEIVMGIVNGVNAGTVQLQAKANGAGTITIESGSVCVVQ